MNVKRTPLMSILRLAIFIALSFCLLGTQAARATTYYVDYTNGSDGNAGTSKTTPWKHAPGMNGVSSLANSTTINPGDSVILKGCVTWPNSAFTWDFPYAGNSSNPIYVGVDKTWWDSTVSGCSSAWNRPVFNLGNAAPTDTGYRIIRLTESYVTFDNFEVMNIAALASPVNGQTDAFDWDANEETNVIVEDMYIHDWINPYFAVGTGNISSGATTVTNFVPYGYSSSPSSAWGTSGVVKLQNINQAGSVIPEGNNTPLLTGVSGSNPYTLTFTNTAGGATANCTGCVFQIGGDFFKASGGVEGKCTGCVMLNNVIDGSDTAEAQLNSYLDCGASEGNNQFCVASSTAGWRQPNIWRGNVIRYIQSAFVGECSEWSGNLIEGIRLGIDPTGHTNGIECLDDTPSNNVYYNNVERYGNNPNANIPGGLWSIGLLNQVSPASGYTDYVFNNVTYNTLQNVPWGLYPSGTGCCGSVDFFNNTSDGGSVASESNDIVNSCPTGFQSCKFINNHLVSNISSSVLSSCGSNCTTVTNFVQNVSTASSLRYSESLMFPLSPSTLTSTTMATGTNEQSLCAAISAFNTTAGAACMSDTAFGAGYNTTNHTANSPVARTPMPRPATGATGWSIGAYQTPEPSPPTNLTAVSP